MEKFRVNGITGFRGDSSESKIALKQLKREARKLRFHQSKMNEAVLLVQDHFNGAENKFGFSSIELRTNNTKKEIAN